MAGVPEVTFAGGEPTVFPGLFELLQHGSQLGLKSGLVSNGWLIDDAFAGRLAENGCTEVALSVYGHLDEIHDRVTDRPGSLSRIVRAAISLHRQGIIVRVVMVVTAWLQDHLLDASLWSFLGSLNPYWVRTMPVLPIGRSCRNEKLYVNPSVFMAALEELREWTFPYRVSAERLFFREGEELSLCGAKLGKVPAILHDGDIRPCCVLAGDPESRGPWPDSRLAKSANRTSCTFLPKHIGEWAIGCPLQKVELQTGETLITHPRRDRTHSLTRELSMPLRGVVSLFT